MVDSKDADRAADNHREPALQRAVASDAPAILELTRAAYAKWVPVIGREPTPMTVDYGERVREHRIDLLRVGADLAALIEMVPEIDHYLLIENVAVLPSFQGRRYGHRLMMHAETVAASLGLPEMRLYTNKLFAGNVQLYRALGYHAGPGGAVQQESYNRVYMSKSLRRPPCDL